MDKTGIAITLVVAVLIAAVGIGVAGLAVGMGAVQRRRTENTDTTGGTDD